MLLRAWRRQREFKAEDAAAFLGLPLGTYYDAERGVSLPSAQTIIQIQAGTKGAVRANDHLLAWTARHQEVARFRAEQAMWAAVQYRKQHKEERYGKRET